MSEHMNYDNLINILVRATIEAIYMEGCQEGAMALADKMVAAGSSEAEADQTIDCLVGVDVLRDCVAARAVRDRAAGKLIDALIAEDVAGQHEGPAHKAMTARLSAALHAAPYALDEQLQNEEPPPPPDEAIA